jgi:hypothetical protein
VKEAVEITTTSLGIMKDVIPGHHLETEKPYLQAQVKLLFFKI